MKARLRGLSYLIHGQVVPDTALPSGTFLLVQLLVPIANLFGQMISIGMLREVLVNIFERAGVVWTLFEAAPDDLGVRCLIWKPDRS